MKLGVYFKELKIGTLSKVNDEYHYIVNDRNKKKAIEKGYPLFLFNCQEDFVVRELPSSFLELIPEENIDLYLIAGITKEDDDFIKLCKMSMLNLAHADFHIEAE